MPEIVRQGCSPGQSPPTFTLEIEIQPEQALWEEVEDALAKVRSSLGGAAVQQKHIGHGIVAQAYYRRLSNPSACRVDKTRTTEKIATEIIGDSLKKVVPACRKVELLLILCSGLVS